MRYPPPPAATQTTATVATVATVADPGLDLIPHAERALVVKPRRTGYRHRDIIAVDHGTGTLETGEAVRNLPVFAATAAPHLWITTDPGTLLAIMLDRFTYDPAWNYQLMQSDATSTGKMTGTRLVRFGIRVEGRRRQAMHMVWTPQDVTRDASRLDLPADPAGLLRFAQDVRDWLRDNNLPIPSTLTGIAAALLRDARFYPEARGRVPGATNERLREYLPGVHHEMHARPGEHFTQLVALDQHRAYHRTVQTTPLPDSTTLYARGHYGEGAAVWLRAGDRGFEAALSMPGLVRVMVVSRRTRKDEHRPPALDFTGERPIYLWTSEIPFIRSQCDARITAIIAAWTSGKHDTGLPRYGPWAEQQIKAATPYRHKWLKPTLHAVYGLLGARKRGFRTGYRTARGRERTTWLLGPREVKVAAIEFPATQPPTTNVAALGVIQAAIRAKTMMMARTLEAAGMKVTHLHADGLHATGNLPLIDTAEWRIETRDELTYCDRVSWTCDQGDVLPGRDTRQRVEQRRHRNGIMEHACRPARHR